MRIYFISCLLLQLLNIVNIHAQGDFIADQTEGCTDFNVKFTPVNVDMDTITSIKWHFGFGDTISSRNPDTVTYTQSGLKTVVMVINNRKNSAIVKNNFITVHPTVNSSYFAEQLGSVYAYRFIPADEITDTVANYTFTWQYRDVESSDITSHVKNVDIASQRQAIDTFTFDTGQYIVNLRVEDTYGCSSTFERLYIIAEEIPPIPNVFVPPVHEFFIIDPQDINIVLLFQLFNRNGLLLFQQEAPIINWNGKSNAGLDVNTGVYYYILEATEGDPLGRYTKNGFIHVYR